MSYLQENNKPVTLFELGKMRAEGRKIVMLTGYTPALPHCWNAAASMSSWLATRWATCCKARRRPCR